MPTIKDIIKIAFFDVEDSEKDYLKNSLSQYETLFFSEKISQDNAELAKDCQIVSVFADSHIDEHVFAKLPPLKMVATRSTGFDHIDVAEAQKRGIIVCNVPTYGEN